MKLKSYWNLIRGKTTALRPAKLSLSNIKAVIQSWFRKKQMSIGGFPMANHIYEQIIWRRTRVQKISPTCWHLGNCKVCGCDILGKTMEDRGCSVYEYPELQKTMAPCYPDMMDEKEWEEYKIKKSIKLFD